MSYKVKELREKLGLTQEELSLKSGVSRATISALETAKDCATSTKTLNKIAQALGTSVDQIFFGSDV